VGHEQENKGFEFYYYSVDADFIPALGMKIMAGRNFEDAPSSYDEVVINEAAAKRLGYASSEDAIGGHVTFTRSDKIPYSTIVGVVGNYYYRSPKESYLPMLFSYDERGSYLSLKLKAGNTPEVMASLKQAWDHAFPGNVFSYFFLNEQYDQQFKADAQFGRVVATFSGLAVFIACLGLFGLSSYTIVQRTKEISIRKVLGASVTHIVHLLTRDFVKVILISSLIATPLAYFAMEDWLSNYAVRIDLDAWIFIWPIVLILIIAIGTVSVQTLRTALENPVRALKQE
jgi:putative ABC transport system permease protein